MTIDLTDLEKITNDVYFNLYNNKKRFIILMGGAGSGKSIFASQKILYRIITEKNHRILIIRKVGATIQDSVFQQIVETITQWQLLEYCDITKQPMIIKMPLFNSEIIFKGMDDPEKLKSIAGITSIWYEEATESSENEFKEINRRLRGETNNYKQIIMSFNPVDANHWLKRHFFDNVDNKTEILKTTYKNNRFLDDDYKAELESETDEILYNIYTLGEWGVYKGAIFTNWEVKDLVDIKKKYISKLRHGLDWGVNDPLAVCSVAVDTNKKELYIFDEIYRKGIKTNAEIAKLIKPLVEKRLVVCDNAEPKSITEIQLAGINAIACTKGKDSIIAGIKHLRQYKIYIDSKCVNAINEFRNYRWRVDRNGTELDEPLDMNNHYIDSVRYALSDLINMSNMLKVEFF